MRGDSKLRDAFLQQAEACGRLGSPFMARLMRLLAARLRPGAPVADRLFAWPGDVSPRGAALPLRLAGALHALVLEGADEGLARAYPSASRPHGDGKPLCGGCGPARAHSAHLRGGNHSLSGGGGEDESLWQAVAAALRTHEARLLRWLDSPPQTNEVRRSAVLLAAAAWLRERFDMPLRVSEIGASAGLNMHFDRFLLDLGRRRLGTPASPVRLTPEWRGGLPPDRPIEVAERAGVDLNPLNPADPADRLRLLAYIWPDQPERLTLTRAAIALADTRPARGDAAPWLAERLASSRPRRNTLHLVYHTIVWQYLAPETQAACEAALARAGADATPAAPLAHLAMASDDDPETARITLDLWPSPAPRQTLGRADFHGRFVDWRG